MSLRPNFINAGLFVFSLVFSFVVAEVLVRVFVPHLGMSNLQIHGLGWASDKFRDFNPYEANKKNCKKNILFLGDSYLHMEAWQKEFPKVADERMSDACIRIIASGAWGNDQELLAFLARGAAWNPDIVFIAYTAINDNANNLSNYPNKPYFVADGKGELTLFTFNGDRVDDVEKFIGRMDIPNYQSYALNLLKYYYRQHMERLRILIARMLPDRVKNFIKSLFPSIDRVRVDESGTIRVRGDANVDWRYKLWERDRPNFNPNRRFLMSGNDVDDIADLKSHLKWSPQNTVSAVDAYIEEDFELNAYGWWLTRNIIRYMRDVTKEIDAELVVMTHPDTLIPADLRFVTGNNLRKVFETPDGPFTFSVNEPVKRLDRICKDLGVRFWNPNPEFIKRAKKLEDPKVLWPDPGDPHYYDLGHAMMGEILVEYLNETYGLQ